MFNFSGRHAGMIYIDSVVTVSSSWIMSCVWCVSGCVSCVIGCVWCVSGWYISVVTCVQVLPRLMRWCSSVRSVASWKTTRISSTFSLRYGDQCFVFFIYTLSELVPRAACCLNTPSLVLITSCSHLFLKTLVPLIYRCQFFNLISATIRTSSGEDKETSFLFQRISVLIQCFNSVLLHDSFTKDGPD